MSSAVEPAASPALHKRHMNEQIHESLQEHVRTEPIGFFCECASPSCFDTVWLTAADYENGRLNPRWSVHAVGH